MYHRVIVELIDKRDLLSVPPGSWSMERHDVGGGGDWYPTVYQHPRGEKVVVGGCSQERMDRRPEDVVAEAILSCMSSPTRPSKLVGEVVVGGRREKCAPDYPSSQWSSEL